SEQHVHLGALMKVRPRSGAGQIQSAIGRISAATVVAGSADVIPVGCHLVWRARRNRCRIIVESRASELAFLSVRQQVAGFSVRRVTARTGSDVLGDRGLVVQL